MRRLLLIALSFFFLVAANVGVAAPRPPLQPTSDDLHLAINGPAERAEFDAKRRDRAFGFVASAGESVSIEVDGSTFADACGVDLQVLDSADRVVAQQTCASGRGQVTTLTVATAGEYRVQLSARTESVGAISVALRVASRPATALPLACIQASLPLDNEASGTWDAGCASVSFPGHNAQYYTISVPQAQVITISLGSAANSYLVLHAGAAPTGAVLAQNDNSGPGVDALLTLTLAAGTYTIEATTALAGQVGNFAVAARTNAAPCFGRLTPNRTVRSSWITTCSSVSFDDHYSRYFALSVPVDEVVTITASSSVNTYLVLRSGTSQLGAVVAQDDNSGPGTDARIVRTLAAGDYTVEATTATAGESGKFSIVARTNDKPCFKPLALDVTASSKWTKACSSVSFADHYSKYYQITVPTREVVTISLHSTINPYLVLRAGDSQLGPVVAQNDNSGPGVDAQIVLTLDPGTYTVEATTADANQLGDFDLTARTNKAPCFQALTLDTAAPSQWIAECASVSFDDHYSKYYTFEVPQTQIITLSLSSATDGYLVLRSGASQLGSVVAQDDNSGAGRDARVVANLAAGTYTVEATTAAAGQLGSYSIAARTNTAPCFANVGLVSVTLDAWITDCTSVSFNDHFSKYYTLQVPSDQSVSILLQSATDAYLVLRTGNGQLGGVIAQDNNSGGGLNAKITRTLAAGVYTIEATTALPSESGSFTLTIAP